MNLLISRASSLRILICRPKAKGNPSNWLGCVLDCRKSPSSLPLLTMIIFSESAEPYTLFLLCKMGETECLLASHFSKCTVGFVLHWQSNCYYPQKDGKSEKAKKRYRCAGREFWPCSPSKCWRRRGKGSGGGEGATIQSLANSLYFFFQ